MRNQFLFCLSLSFIANSLLAQELPFLLQSYKETKPEWTEFLQMQINPLGDTIYTANGQRLDAALSHCDTYDSLGNWQGVDRWVWESENVLRVYHYQGSEEMIVWEEEGRLLKKIETGLDYQIETDYIYENNRIERISISQKDSLEEWVFVYQGQQQRLIKVKHFQNGKDLGVIQLSYNALGQKAIEEYWEQGELQKLLSFTYDDQANIQTILVMNQGPQGAFLSAKLEYSWHKNGAKQELTSLFTKDATVVKTRRRTFDQENRLVKVQHLNFSPNTYQEIKIYAYSADEKSMENISLHAQGR